VTDSKISEERLPFYSSSVSGDGNVATVKTFTNVAVPLNPMDVSLDPQTPSDVQAVMATQRAVHRQLRNVSYHENNVSCMDINKVRYALLMLIVYVFIRYLKFRLLLKDFSRSSIPFLSLDKLNSMCINLYDMISTSHKDCRQWCCNFVLQMLYNLALSRSSKTALDRFHKRGSSIAFHADVESDSQFTWVVRGLDLEYGTNGHLDVTTHAYTTDDVMACKLLSPFRAMEWIYIDSLKRTS